nr:MAG TPA: hypothetical protein [Caudoviricetes sp.]
MLVKQGRFGHIHEGQREHSRGVKVTGNLSHQSMRFPPRGSCTTTNVSPVSTAENSGGEPFGSCWRKSPPCQHRGMLGFAIYEAAGRGEDNFPNIVFRAASVKRIVDMMLVWASKSGSTTERRTSIWAAG